MGLLKAAFGSTGGALADQWKEMIYCESLPADVLVRKGQKRQNDRTSNTKGDDNVISNGSIVVVNDGQCMVIVEQGKVVDFCAEPGEFTYDTSLAPSVFTGGLGKGILDTFKNVGKRLSFGGDTGVDQRVYYFNTKEIIGNKYGTANSVPFRVVDKNIGLDIDISVRCNGEYSYKIVDPLLFYANVCGNVEADYTRAEITSMLRTELLTALQPAFAKISAQGVRYSAVPAHTAELADALNEQLSSKWTELRGLKIVSFGVSTIAADAEDEQLIKNLQKNAVMRDPTMAAAMLTGAQADAMVGAANNQNAGAFAAFAGVNMAQQAGGMNAANLFQMGGVQQAAPAPAAPAAAPAPAADSWTCSCGHVNTGKFCMECGSPKPAPAPAAGEWTCSCGHVNTGKFCMECGKPKPADQAQPHFRCDKCGWEPEDPTHLPKFCPNCGDVFDENDKA